ncbi:MAG: glycosyltransferase [Cyanobacteria bacterium J06623_7]
MRWFSLKQEKKLSPVNARPTDADGSCLHVARMACRQIITPSRQKATQIHSRFLTNNAIVVLKMIETVAYLAPEIPSVSGTFVYQEIIALQEAGIKVVPISVHQPAVVVQDDSVRQLAAKTTYLYRSSLVSVLAGSMSYFLQHPAKYLATLFTVVGDILTVGSLKLGAWKLLYQFLYASRVARLLEENSCQYLHIHFAHVPTQIGMYASLLTGIPFSFTAHANDLYVNKLLLREKAARAKAAVTISEYNRQFMRSQGVDEDKLAVVRCGIKTGEHNYRSGGTRSSPLKIGSLGRLVAKKGMDDLLLALGQLHRQGIDFQLEIAGDGELRDRLEEIAVAQGIADKLKFVGAMPHELVYDWMNSLDVFVLACKQDDRGDRDGIPVVLMEAMTLGVPVVSTQISGVSELIEHERSGFLAESNCPESLARAIERVLHADSLESITQAARQRIETEFELKTNVERLLSVFNA